MNEVQPGAKMVFFFNTPEMSDDLQLKSNVQLISRALDKMAPGKVFVYKSTGRPGAASMDVMPELKFVDRVIDAYTSLACNYTPEAEIYLIGFSTGAYAARTLSDIIGAIGIVDPTIPSTNIPQLIVKYQKYRNARTTKTREKLKGELAPFLSSNSPSKQRMNPSGRVEFPVTCLVLFEDATLSTVLKSGEMKSWHKHNISNVLRELYPWHVRAIKETFGCPRPYVGNHVQYVYQALAVHETRYRCSCNKLKQTQKAKDKGQILRQCWFSGDRLDIGGGHQNRDRSDFVLFWMLANLSQNLSFNIDQLMKVMMRAVQSQGKHLPDSAVCEENCKLPIKLSSHETVHTSVLGHLNGDSVEAISSHLEPLQLFERELWSKWKETIERAK